MFCTQCGAPLDEGQRFCSNCGAPNPAAAAPAPAECPVSEPVIPSAEPPVSPAPDAIPPEPPVAPPPYTPEPPVKARPVKKRKGKAGAIVAIVLVVLLLGAGAFAALRWNTVSAFCTNFAAKTFSSPEEYYQKVEKGNLKVVTAALEKNDELLAPNRALLPGVEDKCFEEKLQISLNAPAFGTTLLDLFEDEAGFDPSWLKNVGAYLSVAPGENGAKGGIVTLFLNDKDIIGLNVYVDPAKGVVYGQIPRLSEQYIRIDMEEYVEQFAAVAEAEQLQIDPETFSILLDRYSELVLAHLKDVEKGSGEFSAGGVTGKFTTLTVRADGETLRAICVDVLKKLQNDREVEDLICAALKSGGLDEETVRDEFYDVLDSLAQAQKSLEEKKAEELTQDMVMTLYLDSVGRIAAREIEIHDKGELVFEGEYAFLVSGKDFGARVRFSDMEEKLETVLIEGGGTIDGLTEVKGSFDAFMTKEDGTDLMKLETVDFSLRTDGDTTHAEADILPSAELMDLLMEDAAGMPDEVDRLIRGLSLNVTADSGSNRLAFRIAARTGSDELLALGFDMYEVAPFTVGEPADSIDVDEFSENLDYMKLMDFAKDLMADLIDAGVPASLLGGLGLG